jgi:hypothetical protein
VDPRLHAALEDPKWDFRTVDGIARELGISPDRAREMLEHSPALARKSVMTDRQGRELFTARGRRPGMRERLEQIRWVLAR